MIFVASPANYNERPSCYIPLPVSPVEIGVSRAKSGGVLPWLINIQAASAWEILVSHFQSFSEKWLRYSMHFRRMPDRVRDLREMVESMLVFQF